MNSLPRLLYSPLKIKSSATKELKYSRLDYKEIEMERILTKNEIKKEIERINLLSWIF